MGIITEVGYLEAKWKVGLGIGTQHETSDCFRSEKSHLKTYLNLSLLSD